VLHRWDVINQYTQYQFDGTCMLNVVESVVTIVDFQKELYADPSYIQRDATRSQMPALCKRVSGLGIWNFPLPLSRRVGALLCRVNLVLSVSSLWTSEMGDCIKQHECSFYTRRVIRMKYIIAKDCRRVGRLPGSRCFRKGAIPLKFNFPQSLPPTTD
jgi:hypothetical protein